MHVADEPKLTRGERRQAIRPRLDPRERLSSEQRAAVDREDRDVMEDPRIAIVECDARGDTTRKAQCPGIELQVKRHDVDGHGGGRGGLARRRLPERASNGYHDSDA